MSLLEKVTAFVTQVVEGRCHLLVFRHPTAGLQLPAGTVEHGESAELAARREVAEETGLSSLQLVAFLRSTEHQLDPAHRIVVESSSLRCEPDDASALTGSSIRRGIMSVIDRLEREA